MDIISFVFYDFILRLFDLPTPSRTHYLGVNEFTKLLNHYLFPSTSLTEISNIPQNNITAAAFQMYTYHNNSVYHSEADHLYKFLQVDNMMLGQPKSNLTFNQNITCNYLFNIVDNDQDGWINFYDFGNFMQIVYLFGKFDTYNRYKIVAGDLYEKYTNYAEFPAVSFVTKERAKRFNLLQQDIYVDVLRTVLVLRIDDIIKATVRRVDPTTLYEVELKNIFANVNMRAVPDALLNHCLRGMDDNKVPKYDWECAFIEGLTATLKYYENSDAYLTTKSQNLTLANTVFINTDPAIAR